MPAGIDETTDRQPPWKWSATPLATRRSREASHHGKPSSSNRRQRRIPTALAGLGIAVALTVVPGTGTATAAGPAAPAAATTYKTQITQADSAIARAIRKVHAHQYSRARTALATARGHIKQANTGAMALIGKPPTDPESDDLPGPPAVLAGLELDNRVVTQGRAAVQRHGPTRGARRAPIDGRRHPEPPRHGPEPRSSHCPPRETATTTRTAWPTRCPCTAARWPSSPVPSQTFRLSPSGKDGLTAALRRARDAEAKMNAAYGGGERPAAQG